MQKEGKTIIKGSLILGISAFLAKLIGAIYRVPLTNELGALGLGLYQMVFPVYTLLLDFSGAGVPNALSKIISGEKDYSEKTAVTLFLGTKKVLTVLGVIGTLLMMGLSYVISYLQGNTDCYLGYIFLSPSVFLVALISCYRGYFQGLTYTAPTGISQVIEQAVKMVAGLILVKLLSVSVPVQVGGATLAVTLSELTALIFLKIIFNRRLKKENLSLFFDREYFESKKRAVLKYTLLITAIGIAIPFSQFIDSFLIINIIGKYSENATSLYGIFSGAINTVINLPVSVCYGISVIAIPVVAKQGKKTKKTTALTLVLTLILTLPCLVFCYVFSNRIIGLLFPSFNSETFLIAEKMLKAYSPVIILLPLLQSVNAILIGKGKPQLSLIGMGIGVAVKTLLNLILLRIESINIYGAVISVIACYFIAVLVNLILIIIKDNRNANKENTVR